MGRTFLYVSIGIGVFFIFFMILTWYVIRNTEEDWSKKKEYVSLTGKTFHTSDTVFLTKQFEHEYFKEGYRLELNKINADSTTIEFPVGSEVTINSIEYSKRGVSGVEYIYILGVLNLSGNAIPFEYVWATPRFYHDNEADKWSYTTTFWK